MRRCQVSASLAHPRAGRARQRRRELSRGTVCTPRAARPSVTPVLRRGWEPERERRGTRGERPGASQTALPMILRGLMRISSCRPLFFPISCFGRTGEKAVGRMNSDRGKGLTCLGRPDGAPRWRKEARSRWRGEGWFSLFGTVVTVVSVKEGKRRKLLRLRFFSLMQLWSGSCQLASGLIQLPLTFHLPCTSSLPNILAAHSSVQGV